uniref:Branched-chain amino acid ABC transporter permease n=1 Tax=Archaeoglobus fulgidus TaxID=2234 RepID=A0A7J2THA7_ARCFL
MIVPIFFSAVIYASLAICILLSYRVAKIVNLSLGSIYTLGGYLSLFNSFVSPIFGALIGLLLHIFTRRLDLSRATLFSLGLAIAIEEFLRIIFRAEYILLNYSKIFYFFNYKILFEHFLAFLISAAFLISFLIFELKKSLSKLKLKIIEEDLENAEIYGIDTEKIRAIVLIIVSAFFCCIGSLNLRGGLVTPTIGWLHLIFSLFIATIANAFREKAYILVFPISLGVCLLI